MQEMQPDVDLPNPPEIAETMVSYQEQCALFKWVHKQICTQGLVMAYLPSEKRLNKLDWTKSQRVSQLAKDIFAARKSCGEEPKILRLCLAQFWGFSPRHVGKDDVTAEALRKDVLACNQAYYKELPQPCSDADLQKVVIFPVSYAREWNKKTQNATAVLVRTIARKGVGLPGVAHKTGMQLGFIKDGRFELEIEQPGQGSYDKQLKRRLRELVTNHSLPPEQIPDYATTQSVDPCLATAIRNYSKSAKRAGYSPGVQVRLTSVELLAEEMNWHVPLSVYFPPGHWQVYICWVMQTCTKKCAFSLLSLCYEHG